MIDPEKLTIKAQQALGQAQSLAQTMKHQEIDVEHLLLALTGQRDGVIVPLLQKMGVNLASLEESINAELEKRPRLEGETRHYASQRLELTLDRAWELARGLKDEYISTEHVLMAFWSPGGPRPRS